MQMRQAAHSVCAGLHSALGDIQQAEDVLTKRFHCDKMASTFRILPSFDQSAALWGPDSTGLRAAQKLVSMTQSLLEF